MWHPTVFASKTATRLCRLGMTCTPWPFATGMQTARHASSAWIGRLCASSLLAASLWTPAAAAAVEKGSPPAVTPLLAAIELRPTLGEATLFPRATPTRRARFDGEPASLAAQQLVDWVLDSGDNRAMPFLVVDKTQAKVFVFYSDGRLRGAAPALLGLAIGDDSVPGIGERKLSSIRPEERTTPAGRFVAALDRNLHGEEILWVDYDSAISLHRVVTSNPKERRAQRLRSPAVLDKRISYGCINVPVQFYEKIVSPTLTGTNGIVYVLPETRSAHDVFGSYDVQERHRLQTANPALPAQEIVPTTASITR